jgi:hypothetical protein
LGPLGTAFTNMPVVPAPGNYDDGEIGGMMIGRGNRSTRRKPAPVPLCLPQIPHAGRTRTWAAAVGSQRLTASATAQPISETYLTRLLHMGICERTGIPAFGEFSYCGPLGCYTV